MHVTRRAEYRNLQCDVNLKPGVDRTQPDIAKSLHKTFTDCYDAPDGGFTGGHWAVNALNERHNVYLLGWDSREVCSGQMTMLCGR